jgi:hypothetical protein
MAGRGLREPPGLDRLGHFRRADAGHFSLAPKTWHLGNRSSLVAQELPATAKPHRLLRPYHAPLRNRPPGRSRPRGFRNVE